jgi:hypothetical protein
MKNKKIIFNAAEKMQRFILDSTAGYHNYYFAFILAVLNLENARDKFKIEIISMTVSFWWLPDAVP